MVESPAARSGEAVDSHLDFKVTSSCATESCWSSSWTPRAGFDEATLAVRNAILEMMHPMAAGVSSSSSSRSSLIRAR